MNENEISELVIGICIDIHIKFGPGLFESIYEEAISSELIQKGISFTQQQGIKVFYNDKDLGLGFRADFIIENKVIVEIKSIDTIASVHKKQVLTYLRLTGIKLGLLINFNVNLLKEGIFRIANNL